MSSGSRIEGESEKRFAPVREVFARSFETGEVGAAVCVTIAGQVVLDLWGGHRDAARTQAWTRDTLVNVYSTTKGVTAICANRLAEKGLLDLDAPVAHYWPEFAAEDKDRIPVRWLLCHKSGVAALREDVPAARALRLEILDRGAGRRAALVGAGHAARLSRAQLRPSRR